MEDNGAEMVRRVAGWLAGSMVVVAVGLFLLRGDFSGPIGTLAFGGVGLAVVAVGMGQVGWRPTSRDPGAESARSRLEYIWRSGYGGNAN